MSLPTGIHPKTPGQGVGIHGGEAANDFSLPFTPIDEDPGVNDPHLNYSMELALMVVPHTIKKSCSSTGLVRPTQWSINVFYT